MYQTTVVFVSISTMVLMTVERYLAVVYPIESMAYRYIKSNKLYSECLLFGCQKFNISPEGLRWDSINIW